MTATTKSVHELLYMSYDKYADMYEVLYFKWCENLSKKDDIVFQKILANSSVSKWYLTAFTDLEDKFVEMAAPQYGKVSHKVARELYHTIVSGMFLIYPAPLIIAAKNLQINSN